MQILTHKLENDKRQYVPITNRILWVKSLTRKNLYHIVNIDKNRCSCENYQYEGQGKSKFDYRCKHLTMTRRWLCLGDN